MRLLAYLCGLLILALGLLGLLDPTLFVALVGPMQHPPALYAAAAVRLGVGIVLFVAAPLSRAKIPLRILGVLIGVGGAVTPFIGEAMGQRILDNWSSGGPSVVRIWGAGGTALAGFVFWALRPRQG